MLAQLGKYEQNWAFFFKLLFHPRWICTSAIDSISRCLMIVALGGCRTGDISWLIDKGSQWLHVGKSQEQIHLDMDTSGAEAAIPVWTHTLTLEGGPLRRPWEQRWSSALLPRDTLMWLLESFVVQIHWVTVLAGLLWHYCHCSQQSNIGLCCWKMYLPVHFVYKKPEGALAFFFLLYKQHWVKLHIIVNAL